MQCFVSGRPGRLLPKGGPGSPEVGGLGGREQPRLSPNGRHVPLLPAGAVSPMGDPALSRGETFKRNEIETNERSRHQSVISRSYNCKQTVCKNCKLDLLLAIGPTHLHVAVT